MKTSLIQAFSALRAGETVPYSRFPVDVAEELLLEGGARSIVHGSRKSLKVVSRAAYDVFLRSKGLLPEKLEETVDALRNRETRGEQVHLTGDSKAVAVRTCPGFPVNVIGPMPLSVRLGERKILLCPCTGSFLYISDFRNFRIPSDAIVVGVENMENFRLPERQTAVWEQIREQYGDGGVPPILLVSRYPQSKDLVSWLQEIPNPYVHFGDFDLAGISIYLTEFYRHLGERSAFFIPEDIEDFLSNGSRKRYDDQFPMYGKMDITDPRLEGLVQLLHRHQKGYDQEGFIE